MNGWLSAKKLSFRVRLFAVGRFVGDRARTCTLGVLLFLFRSFFLSFFVCLLLFDAHAAFPI